MFNVKILDWADAHELPGSWPSARLREVLQQAEYDDAVDEADLADMASMVLQDLGVRHATELVLEVVFGSGMTPGVRQNIVDDLQEDRPWDGHSVIAQQAGIFESVVLLQRAFPTRFDLPRALRIVLEISPVDAQGQERLAADAGNIILRLAGAGMGPDAVLNRVYSDDMARPDFKRAGEVLWHLEADELHKTFTLYSSEQWFGDLEDHAPWRARG